MSSYTVPKVPLGEVNEPESAVAIKNGASTKLNTLQITDANRPYFIMPGHVVMMAYYSSALHPGEIQKADASTTGTVFPLGVAITHSNVYPGQSQYINNTDISFHAADDGRVTYMSRGVAYIRVDPVAQDNHAITVGGAIEVTDQTDTDATVASAAYRKGCVCLAAANDTEHVRVGYALETVQTYIPFDPQSWDAQFDGTGVTAGTGIEVVKVLLDFDHSIEAVA